jgi:hypothetical protein
MALYTVTKTSAAASITNDSVTILASSTKPLRVYIVDIKGDGTASAANEILLSRSTGGTTAGGAITPSKVVSTSSAASFTTATTWSAQPTLGDTLWRFSVNANGGIDKFIAVPGAEISVPVSGQLSIRSIDGTSNIIINMLIEEIDG